MEHIATNAVDYIARIEELEKIGYNSFTDGLGDYYDDKFNNIIQIDTLSKEYNTIHRENPVDTILSNLTPEDLASTKEIQ